MPRLVGLQNHGLLNPLNGLVRHGYAEETRVPEPKSVRLELEGTGRLIYGRPPSYLSAQFKHPVDLPMLSALIEVLASAPFAMQRRCVFVICHAY